MSDYSNYEKNNTSPPSEDAPSIANQREAPSVYSTSYYSSKHASPPPPPPVRVSNVRERVQKRRSSVRRNGEWAWVLSAGVLFAVVLVASLSIFLYVRAAASPTEIIPTASVVEILPTPVIARSDFSASTLGLEDSLIMADGTSIALTPWDGQGRFTIVVVGLDRRPGETGLAYRTDTILLVSLDPGTASIGVLSIPRDLYVEVPGYSQLQRINSPMVYGETQQPGYGPTLLMQTVQNNLGIRVHDYVAVDFEAFIDVVNAIGGIDIMLEYVINDPQYPNMNYGYDPFYLAPGQHSLDGYNALRFARTRHGDSDIRRAERQQQVIYAIRDKVMDLEMLPVLIPQFPALWNSLSNNIYTGLTFEQVIQLALYAAEVPRENITMGVINYEYLRAYTTPGGSSVLIPDRARLGNLMVNIFGSTYTQ